MLVCWCVGVLVRLYVVVPYIPGTAVYAGTAVALLRYDKYEINHILNIRILD